MNSYDDKATGLENPSHPANQNEFFENVYEVAVYYEGQKMESTEFEIYGEAKELFEKEVNDAYNLDLQGFKDTSIEFKKNGNIVYYFDADQAFDYLTELRRNAQELVSLLSSPLKHTSDELVRINQLKELIK